MRKMLLLGLILLGGCVSRVGDFSLLANQNVAVEMRVVKRSVVGEECRIMWSAGMLPSIEGAVEDAQRKAGAGNALMNATVEFEQRNFILLAQNCYRVRGDVVQIESGMTAAESR